MTARFKKVHHVSLVNESVGDETDGYDVQLESDKALLINEEEGEEREGVEGEENHVGESVHTFAPSAGKRGIKWQFWKKQKRYEVSHTEHHHHHPPADEAGRAITVCGRTFHICQINSWRAIFLALSIFSVAVTVSVILSKVLAEPTARQGKVATPPGL